MASTRKEWTRSKRAYKTQNTKVVCTTLLQLLVFVGWRKQLLDLLNHRGRVLHDSAPRMNTSYQLADSAERSLHTRNARPLYNVPLESLLGTA